MIINIPLRAKTEADFPQLKLLDKKIVAAAVLLQLDNQTAFALYHPEYIDSNGRLNESGKQDSKFFWNYGKVRDYRAAYETTVEEFLNGKKKTHVDVSDDNVSSDNRKDRAIRKLVSDCLDAIENNVALDPETLKDFVTMAKALGVLKDEEEQQEKPRRYLPTKCLTDCAYRLFVETQIESGNIISECDYCRTRRFAEANGWHFDATKNLDLPINTNSDEQNI